MDIDAKDETPVFVSRKLMEYLSCNRYILHIGQLDSPSYYLTKNLKNSLVRAQVNRYDIIKGFQNAFQKDGMMKTLKKDMSYTKHLI